jgi:ketopantoate reductase
MALTLRRRSLHRQAIGDRIAAQTRRLMRVSLMMRDVVDECMAVAKAGGVEVPGDIDSAMAKIVEPIPNQYSSTARNIMRGRPTELDFLNGHIVRRGKELGIRTPENQVCGRW